MERERGQVPKAPVCTSLPMRSSRESRARCRRGPPSAWVVSVAVHRRRDAGFGVAPSLAVGDGFDGKHRDRHRPLSPTVHHYCPLCRPEPKPAVPVCCTVHCNSTVPIWLSPRACTDASPVLASLENNAVSKTVSPTGPTTTTNTDSKGTDSSTTNSSNTATRPTRTVHHTGTPPPSVRHCVSMSHPITDLPTTNTADRHHPNNTATRPAT